MEIPGGNPREPANDNFEKFVPRTREELVKRPDQVYGHLKDETAQMQKILFETTKHTEIVRVIHEADVEDRYERAKARMRAAGEAARKIIKAYDGGDAVDTNEALEALEEVRSCANEARVILGPLAPRWRRKKSAKLEWFFPEENHP